MSSLVEICRHPLPLAPAVAALGFLPVSPSLTSHPGPPSSFLEVSVPFCSPTGVVLKAFFDLLLVDCISQCFIHLPFAFFLFVFWMMSFPWILLVLDDVFALFL